METEIRYKDMDKEMQAAAGIRETKNNTRRKRNERRKAPRTGETALVGKRAGESGSEQ